MKANEKRAYLRHSMCLPLSFSLIEGGRRRGSRERSETRNISRGGLLFSAKQKAEEGSLIEIKIPFQNKLFKIKAEVTHFKKNSETGLYDIGVKFIQPKEAFRAKLIEQLYLISEYRDLQSVKLNKEISLQDACREWIQKYSDKFNKLYW